MAVVAARVPRLLPTIGCLTGRGTGKGAAGARRPARMSVAGHELRSWWPLGGRTVRQHSPGGRSTPRRLAGVRAGAFAQPRQMSADAGVRIS